MLELQCEFAEKAEEKVSCWLSGNISLITTVLDNIIINFSKEKIGVDLLNNTGFYDVYKFLQTL